MVFWKTISLPMAPWMWGACAVPSVSGNLVGEPDREIQLRAEPRRHLMPDVVGEAHLRL